ncbi:dihydropteroate synthase [Candidatus Micrarchaeota archaeon]|nr:dihydropteroate synthase [Candidatus Micrarchaeota archaeon]
MKIGKQEFKIGERTYILGILNVTPDSFYDGGAYYSSGRAIDHARYMIQSGADIIDIGGESSRPGSKPITPKEEKERILPIIKQLVQETDVPLSVDTYKAEVAKAALEAGASMVNDITALGGDKQMASVVKKFKVPVVLMHMQGTPETMQKNPKYKNVIKEVSEFLKKRASFAIRNGIDESNIILDPGIGFGKTTDHNLEIIANLKEFKKIGYPVLLGPSRKSFIGKILGDLPPEERFEGTLGASAISIFNDVDFLRVHDVKSTLRVGKVVEAIKKFV